MDRRILDLLVCPICKGSLKLAKATGAPGAQAALQGELVCVRDRLAFPVRDDIPVMLVDAARALDADESVA